MLFCFFNFVGFRIGLDFCHDSFDLFQFQIDDVIHDALGNLNMFLEQFEIKISILCKRIDHVGIEVDGQQTTAVVRAQWDFAARIGADRAET